MTKGSEGKILQLSIRRPLWNTEQKRPTKLNAQNPGGIVENNSNHSNLLLQTGVKLLGRIPMNGYYDGFYENKK